MAAAKVKDEFSMTCCLGDHPLQNPKLLPCQHSFCTGCVKTEVGQERKLFTCPKCQLSIPLTEKDVDQLPEDVLFHITQETKTRNDCVLCKFQDKKTPGTFQCLDCGDVLCGECQKGHTSSSQTRLHRVVSRRDIKQGKYKNEANIEKQLVCDIHSKPNKPRELEYYCEECKVLVCQLCALREHQPQGHICNTIDEIHDEKMADVHDHVTMLLDLKRAATEFAAVLEQELEQNKDKRGMLENEIHNKAAKFIDMIEKVKEETLEKIKCHFDTENTAIQTKLEETKNNITRIDSLVSYTHNVLKLATKSRFLIHQNSAKNSLTHQRQQMGKRGLKINVLDIGEPEFVLSPESIAEAFGKLIVNKVKNVIQVKSLYEMKANVLFCDVSLPVSTYDVSVTGNGDIVAVGGSTIQIYNNDGRPKEKIQCWGVNDLWNVVARGDTYCVSDRTPDPNVFEIDFKGHVRKNINLPKLKSMASFGNKGLAVDDESNVYISSVGTQTIYKCKSNEPNAKVFIQQGSQPDLRCPMYLCVTPGGELVVSNRDSNAIQVYDKHGVFLWQYKGQGGMKLSQPRGVCCDRTGNIYIADFENDRIQMIKDEDFLRCIKLPTILQPRCLDIDADDNIVCGYMDDKKLAKIQIWE